MKPTNYKGRALYLGERTGVVGGIFQQFRDVNTGQILRFAGLRGLIPGTVYEYDDEKGQIARRPQWVDDPTQMTKDEELEFEAHKEIIKDLRLRKRKALEVKKPHKDIVKALELLRPFCRRLDSIELHRFTRYLENQLSKKRKK